MSSTRKNSEERHERDDYQTPWPFADQIAKQLVTEGLVFPGALVLEPCAGEGRLLRCLQHYCSDLKMFAAEINPAYREHLMPLTLNGDRLRVGDFKDALFLGVRFDLIVTNPPFSLTEMVIKKAVPLLKPGGRLVLLQRLAYMAGKDRQQDVWLQNDYDRLWVLSRRPNFIPKEMQKGKKKNGDSTDYGWFGLKVPSLKPAQLRTPTRPRQVTIVHLPAPELKESDVCRYLERNKPRGLHLSQKPNPPTSPKPRGLVTSSMSSLRPSMQNSRTKGLSSAGQTLPTSRMNASPRGLSA